MKKVMCVIILAAHISCDHAMSDEESFAWSEDAPRAQAISEEGHTESIEPPADIYRLTSWRGVDGDTRTIQSPSCPSGYTLAGWGPISSYDNWSSVGLCVKNGYDSYAALYIKANSVAGCPSGYDLRSHVSVSSYLYWSYVSLCISSDIVNIPLQLTSWRGADGDVHTTLPPTCPSGWSLTNYVALSSYDNWTTVGICRHY
ncbi:hypothetical protein F0U61_06180 [Archangium violaceum]|uniref:hypothetical protein n=1 Tax=Archangium violaceum TaxID=83451 RepID=UPI002B2C0EF8|nr:hypothetical protein F0U61_06180 [Archangium violaceum]